jgi:hypothetical protein
MSRLVIPLLLLCLTLEPTLVFGQAATCDQKTAMRADAEADALRTWPQIHDSFLRYRLCDDGSIAEGYSNSVVSMLSDRWDELPSLQTLIMRDKSFRRFVFAHIDATASLADLEAVSKNAEHRCPHGFETLCKDIRARVREAGS